MSLSNLVRSGGGLTSIVAGALLLLGHLLNLGGDPQYGTALGSLLVLIAYVLLVFALVALYAAQAERSGSLGASGMVLGVIGTMLAAGVVLVEIAGASRVEVEPVIGAGLSGSLALLGGLAFLIGLILSEQGTRAVLDPRKRHAGTAVQDEKDRLGTVFALHQNPLLDPAERHRLDAADPVWSGLLFCPSEHPALEAVTKHEQTCEE